MALSGDGSQANPWVAQNYTDLRTAYNNLATSGGTKYLEIDRDINCNDYGDSFEWNTLSVGGNQNRAMIFDLKTHTIKNIKVASGNTIFSFAGSSQSIIKNGKILNIFTANAKGFNDNIGGIYTCSKLQNMSVSINITGSTDNIFDVALDSCAIYVEGSTDHRIFELAYNVSKNCINTDIKLDVNHCSNIFSGSDNVVSKCRIRGKANVPSGGAICSNYPVLEDCVVDLETNAAYISEYLSGSASGVINSDKYSGNLQGMTAVSSTEIINGAALRGKNFVVVNVVGG